MSRRPSDAGAKMRLMTNEARSERTARLLVARLDALAKAASRLRNAEAERLVELASVATMRAVALELIQADRAEAIWREAHLRHPELPVVEVQLPQRLAA
jgi:hypothetical protein